MEAFHLPRISPRKARTRLSPPISQDLRNSRPSQASDVSICEVGRRVGQSPNIKSERESQRSEKGVSKRRRCRRQEIATADGKMGGEWVEKADIQKIMFTYLAVIRRVLVFVAFCRVSAWSRGPALPKTAVSKT